MSEGEEIPTEIKIVRTAKISFEGGVEIGGKKNDLKDWEEYSYTVNLMFKYIDVSIRSNAVALLIGGGIVSYLVSNKTNIPDSMFRISMWLPLTIFMFCFLYNSYAIYQSSKFRKIEPVRKNVNVTVGVDRYLLVRISALCAIVHFMAVVSTLLLINIA